MPFTIRCNYYYIIGIVFYRSITALHFSINPPSHAFLLFSPNEMSNFTNRLLYLQDDCPASTDQHITVSSGNRAETSRLYSSIPNLHCAVTVKVVQDVVKLDRPHVDVLALADMSLLSFFKHSACITVQITSFLANTVSSSCYLAPFEEGKHSCLIRMQIPYSWFGFVGRNTTVRQSVSISHTVSSTCNAPFYDRPQVPLSLLPYIENAQAHTLVKDEQIDLSLLSRANLSFGLNSLNSLFIHLSYNTTEETLNKLEIRLWLDSRFDLLSVSPLSSTEWDVRVMSAAHPLFYTSFICTRKGNNKVWDGYVFAILLKMRGSVLENRKLMQNEEGKETILHWEIRRSESNISQEQIHKVATKFRVTPDAVYALVPVAKNTDIINTGVFSGQQTSSPMRVYTVSVGGIVSDVTSRSHCISGEARVLKTSPTCTTVYVDGSELRGMANIKIHVHFEQWITHIAFTVWYPKMPITLWMKDHVLNSISGWPITMWKNLKEAKHRKRAARQFTCGNRYQQTELRVLASFQVSDDRTGEIIFLSGQRDIMFDITSLAADSIQSSDRSIATVRNFNNRVLVQAIGKGTTRIVLKTQTPNIDFGSSTVVVSDELITVSHLSVVPIVEMNLNIEPINGGKALYNVMVGIDTTFMHRYQHGFFFYQIHYSDDSTEYLDDIINTDFNLAAESSDDRVIALNHKVQNGVDLIVLDDFLDPFVELQLSAPAHCIDPETAPLAVSQVPIHIQFSELDSSRLAVAQLTKNTSTSQVSEEHSSARRMDTILTVIIVLVLIAAVIKFMTARATNFKGYEKLVVPLLSRLSSSSSGGGRDEDTKEWVWLSKARMDNNSIGSRYSQKSTINIPEQSSPSFDDNTQTSISYRGSEISVFISPTPVVTVHADRPVGGSWRSNTRTRAARHALVDSSSDHNLARVMTKSGSWRNEPSWPNHTWNSKKRSPQTYEGLRESVA